MRACVTTGPIAMAMAIVRDMGAGMRKREHVRFAEMVASYKGGPVR